MNLPSISPHIQSFSSSPHNTSDGGVGNGNDAVSPQRTRTTSSSPFPYVPPPVTRFFQKDSMEVLCILMNPTKEGLLHGLDSVVQNLS